MRRSLSAWWCAMTLATLVACGGPTLTAPMAADRDVQPQLLLFDDSECSACLRMRPVVTNLEEQYGGEVRFRYIEVGDAQNKPVVQQYQVSGSPTVVMLNRKGAVAARFAGQVPETDVADSIHHVLGLKAS